jgi:hypothetical protein
MTMLERKTLTRIDHVKEKEGAAARAEIGIDRLI